MGSRRRGRLAVCLSTALIGMLLAWPAGVAAVDNVPPVAVDDPGTLCAPQPYGIFGPSFPIPEDGGPSDFGSSCSAITNDTDSDGSIVAWQIVTPPGHGPLVHHPDFPGIFRYTPDADFNTASGDWVSDSFTYQVIDNLGAFSNVATMRFWVAPINDAPRFLTIPHVDVVENSGPYDVSWLPYVSPGPANESTQSVSFFFPSTTASPFDLFSVSPTFTSDGRLTFTPRPGLKGFASVSVYLRDDGGVEDYGFHGLPTPPADMAGPFTFTIRVAETDPVANDDAVTVGEDAAATTIDVLGNDVDPEGDALTVVGPTQGTKGSVAITGGGAALTYTPNPNATGMDTFT